jgi:hypothetical protein
MRFRAPFAIPDAASRGARLVTIANENISGENTSLENPNLGRLSFMVYDKTVGIIWTIIIGLIAKFRRPK